MIQPPPPASTAPLGPSRGEPDRVLIIAIGLLLVAGLLAMYTASYGLGYRAFGDPGHFVKRQLLWLGLGLVAGAFMFRFDYRAWRRYTVPMILGTVVVLVGILVMGADRFGGQRWVLGGGSIQPSELAKLTVVLYVADWLSSKREDVRDLTLGLVPFALLMGFLCGLVILQPNYSTAIILAAIATAMFFTAGADLRQMLISVAIAGTVLVGLILQSPHARQRVHTFFDPGSDPSGAGYQVLQALDAIKRGGLLGVGLGQGQTKHVLPVAHSDAVFAVLGEEVGLLGCLLLVALFAVVAWRGFRVAAGAPDHFASLLATGVTCWLLIQALVHIAVVTGFMPFTGVPLPFISFGGSSLVTCLAGAGLLLNISRRVNPARARVYVPVDLWRGHRRARLSRAHRARRLGRHRRPGLVARDAG